MRHLILLILVLVISVTEPVRPSFAYDLPAHEAISAEAVGGEGDRLDTVLKAIGFSDGARTRFADGETSLAASLWVISGAASEDKPDPRVVNHFHNPLAPSWDSAGLSVLGGTFRWFSSLAWQQHPAQATAPGIYNGPGSWSWPNARARYFEGLTAASKGDREVAFARLLRTVGQLMHLVQDASLPAHVRNDQHLTLRLAGITLYRDPDGYEEWVNDRAGRPELFRSLLRFRPPLRPATAIFSVPAESSRVDRTLAPVPVSALIDTGQYTGRNPGVTETPKSGQPLVGLSEYANANFLSNNTNSLGDGLTLQGFPYPSRASVEPGPLGRDPATGEVRRYLSKVTHGDRVDYLAVPSALYDFLPEALRDKKLGLDESVFANYGALLLPRAIGYSAALLDYFFRGELEAKLDGNKLRVFNRTDGETMSGKFGVYYDTADGTRILIVERTLTIEPGKDQLVELPPMRPDRPPGEPDSYVLVFRGRLGRQTGDGFTGEEDAVAGQAFKVKPIPGLWQALTYSVSSNGGAPLIGTLLFSLQMLTDADSIEDSFINYTHVTGAYGSLHFLYSIHRDLEAFPARTLTLGLIGTCVESWPYGVQNLDPVPVDVVEFYPPADATSLAAYDLETNPPRVKRVLKAVPDAVYDDPPREVVVDASGARFLGVIVLRYPTSYPFPPTPPFSLNYTGCTARAAIVKAE